MFATAATFALFSLVLVTVVEIIRRDGGKIISALEGRSLAAEPRTGRPVTIRFSQRRMAAGPVPARPALRAAA